MLCYFRKLIEDLVERSKEGHSFYVSFRFPLDLRDCTFISPRREFLVNLKVLVFLKGQ